MPKSYSGPPAMRIDPSKHYQAIFHTSRGDFTVDLLAGSGRKRRAGPRAP